MQVEWVGRSARAVARGLRRSLVVTDDDVEIAAADVTGGESGHRPTIVTDEYVLSTMPDEHVATTLQAAASALGGEGRIAICELCLRPDVIDDEHTAFLQMTASEVFASPLFPRTPSVWWSMLETAGFEVVHRLDGDVRLPRGRSRQRLARPVADQFGVVGLAAIPATPPRSSD